jgi:endoglucanase
MKKTVLTLLFICCAILANAAGPVKQWGQLQVKGAQLCDQNGNPVTLRGASLGWHNLWPRFYNKNAVKWLIDDWHANVIRAAMGIQIEDNYLENPEFAMKCMTPVIEAAIKNGAYVIIDWHAHTMHTMEAKAFFTAMAKKYGKYPNVIYELYNEPINDSWEDLKVYGKTITDAIRTYDKKNIILMGCPHWDQDIDLVQKSPIEGVSNMMYTVHFYAATHKDYLRDKLKTAVESGLPVFVSESAGMEASGDGPLNKEEWQKWINLMEELKVSWVNWSVSDKNETCSMLLPRAKTEGNWTDDVIKPYGKMVRNYLRTLNTRH